MFPSARVVGAPVAGFYFPAYPYTGVNHTNSVLAPFYPYALQGCVIGALSRYCVALRLF